MRKPWIVLSLGSFLFCSCQTESIGQNSAVPVGQSSAGVSLERSEMGHRPGPRGFTTVFLDAGHGGKDSGAVSASTGQQEKALALDAVLRIRRALAGKVNVVLVRSGDNFVDLDERVRIASQRDGAILVSVHYNAGPSHLRGPETYWWRVDSHGLAKRFQAAMEAVSPVDGPNRGFTRRRLRLTRNPDVPSVLLEIGYLSNRPDAALCASPQYRQKMADGIARAILTQKAIGDQGTGGLPKPIDAPPSRPTDPPGS